MSKLKPLFRIIFPAFILMLATSIAVAAPVADNSKKRADNKKLAKVDLSDFSEGNDRVQANVKRTETKWRKHHKKERDDSTTKLAFTPPPCGAYSSGQFCSAEMIGNGWRESYWNNTDLSGDPVVERITTPPYYYWGAGSPDAAVNNDNFSGRWEGTFESPTDDYFKIQLRAASKVRIYIDGALACQLWTFTTAMRACTVNYRVYEGGKKYRIRAEFAHHTGTDARAELVFSQATYGGNFFVLPLNQAYNITHGASTDGAPWDPSEIDDYKTLVGGNPSLLSWGQTWGDTGVKEFDTVKMNDATNRGMVPLIGWGPGSHTATDHVNQPDYDLSSIINGDHDEYIEDFAADAAAWDKEMYLSPMGGMNGDWHPWSPGVNNNTAAEYVDAWRHIHDIFAAEGADNVKFVWTPYRVFDGATPLADVYPGDDYVDWTGMAGYNTGGSEWVSFKDLFLPTYNEILTVAPDKPMMVTETGSLENGGSKSSWIQTAFSMNVNGLEHNMHRIRAVVWTNQVIDGNNWRVDSTSGSLNSFKTHMSQSSAYKGMMTGYNTP